MGKALVQRLIVAKGSGLDLRVLLQTELQKRCSSAEWTSGFVFFFLVLATLSMLVALASLFLKDATALPLLAQMPLLGQMDNTELQPVVLVLLALSSTLFFLLMRVRQDHTRNTILLFMIIDGDVKDAVRLMFSEMSGEKGSLVKTAAETVLGALG